MDKFVILVEGYAHPGQDDNHFFASPTSVLVYSNDKKVLIDPGADKEKLLHSLKLEGLKPSNIDIVYLTHWHPDHFLNIRLFPDVDIYDATTIWSADGGEFFPAGGDSVMSEIPGTTIKILATPGHSNEHSSLLIETEQGKVCIAQDVFWWIDGEQPINPAEEELLKLTDPFHTNIDALYDSRKLVLTEADWIIPGHGKMFKNPLK